MTYNSLGCEGCQGPETGACPTCPGGHGYGYDHEGTYQLGVLPLLAPFLIKTALTVRQQRQSQPQTPSAPQPQPRPGLLSRFFSHPPVQTQETPMSYPFYGAPHPGPGGGAPIRRRIQCVRDPNSGRNFAYDGDSGEFLGEALDTQGYGAGPMVPQSMAYGSDPDADADDFMGGEASDDRDISDLSDEAEELLGAASYMAPDEFGAKEERLQDKLERLNNKVNKLRDRKMSLRGPFKEARANRLQTRIDKIVDEMRDVRRKLNAAKGKRRAHAQAANLAVAAAGGLVAGQVMGGGSTPISRDALTSQVNPALLDPVMAQALRNAQAQAGMRASYQAPAGSGRLVSLPFYATSSTNPRNVLTVPAGGGISSATSLTTEQVSYAKLKVVGFTTTTIGSVTNSGALALVSDLKLKGSANLFIHENPAAAQNYDVGRPAFQGLRNYPNLTSPNQAQVDTYVTGSAAGDADETVTLCCDLVCDVVQDDVYGVGMVGPYT